MARDVRTLPDLPHVGRLIGKAALTALGRPGASAGLPDRSLLVLNHTQDAGRLAAYARLCGFPLRDLVPATWLHVLSFPLQAALMAERDFPFSLAGIVHVTNDMTLHRPVSVRDALRLNVWAENLRPHKRGVTFDICGRIHVGDDLAWSGVSNYLATGAKLAGEPVATPRMVAPEGQASQRWTLPADLGRRYAAVSGDTNPIHLHPLTARPFGFSRPIIHGMWTHARALAAFGGRLPDTYRARVGFTKPIMMPARVGFVADGDRFAVINTDGTKPYLIGELGKP